MATVIRRGSLQGADVSNNTDLYYLRLAHLVALERSKDPLTKVGAIVVSPDGRQTSTGYNGFPRGTREAPDLWERPLKYDRVQHAEVNALLNSPFDTAGCTLYSTLQPCHRCLGAILNARVIRVVWYGAPYNRDSDTEILTEWLSEVEWSQYTEDPRIEALKALYA